MYLPLHNVPEKKYYFKIPGKLCFFTVAAPLYAFISCVILTMYKDFESANKTHCNVPNMFPSISASIGNYNPQSTIWKTAIYFHSPVRFFMILLRWKYYRRVIRGDFDIIVNLAVFLNIIENLALLGLTYWTSSENYPYHEKCFKTFIGTSIFYMLIICTLLTKYRHRPILTQQENNSVKLKWRCFAVNVISFVFAAYFFLRHNTLCEPYVYSLFGLSEYIVVISNIAFHLTTVYDLHINFIYFNKHGLSTEFF